MKLHTVFVTYNRLELTKRAIESYLETVSEPWTAVAVDNGSTDGTQKWLESFKWTPPGGMFHVIPLKENRYPGYACNRGWTWGCNSLGLRWLAEDDPEEAIRQSPTHLHRADNDHIFIPGWCEEVERIFQSEKVGQVGLRTAQEEQYARWNTGGNCVIKRELWDAGLRWDERPWPQLRDEIGPGHTEDSLMSPAVRAMGYTWTRVKQPCIVPISPETPDDPDLPYYKRSWEDRGIVVPWAQ